MILNRYNLRPYTILIEIQDSSKELSAANVYFIYVLYIPSLFPKSSYSSTYVIFYYNYLYQVVML